MTSLLARFCLAVVCSLTCLAAHAGNVDADLRQAAKLHKGGETVPAVAIWKAWAEQGNVDAAYNLAVIHQHGDGVPTDYAEALRWYRVAAERGDKASQFQIGLMYQVGQGVAADQEEAHRWFTMNRRHHLHHEHQPQMVAWRQQALALIEERDRREQVAAARNGSAQVLADLKRRAGISDERPTATVALASQTSLR
ncbi:tetratricopeptide repeat protein [Dechloromonas denitrificans]|uniref:tetratricopeptide repeat protein n=1 Tax=Dechloromonas denitrificans TaxID=281362 RepID=UPI001CF86E79|nr:tetratricopeptide repeat protein [Dechloromonas denitrificans]UCV03597.1 sel1 repeat family protein [Dechloromonas denitrificans]UCV07857.1 sel1 repeat family protein [Dechloromonas denitrificans]